MQTLFNWLSNPAFKALGISLLSSLWQAAIVFIIVYALIQLNKNTSARIKYNLAAVGSLVITIWFFQTFIYYLDLETTLNHQLTEQSAALFYFPGNFPVLSSVYPQAPINPGLKLSGYIPLALIIYFLGVTLLLCKVIYNYILSRQLKKSGLYAAPMHLMQHLTHTARNFHIQTKVQLFLSDKISIPLMLGQIKPIILLPISIATYLSIPQIEAIITHELAHIRRQDYLINFIQSIVEVLFFFNPFIWLLSKIMREEREKACDELVVKSVPPYTYATALLALEKINGTKRLTLAANGHNSFKLLTRIKLFTMKKSPIISVRQKVFSLLLIVTAIGCIAWLSPKQSGAQTEQKSPAKSHQRLTTPVLSASSEAAVSLPKQKTTFQSNASNQTGDEYIKDTLSPEIQQQIDQITASASDIARTITEDTAWQSNLRALSQKALQMVPKFEQDPNFKASIEKITRDAKALSSKMKEDPQLKKRLQDIAQNAQNMAGAFQPSPEMQKQLMDLSAQSASITASIEKDTAWKEQLKHIKFKAEKIARQLKDNPEMQQKIKNMAETYKDIAFKVLNDPKFKQQLEQLHSDINSMHLDLKSDD